RPLPGGMDEVREPRSRVEIDRDERCKESRSEDEGGGGQPPSLLPRKRDHSRGCGKRCDTEIAAADEEVPELAEDEPDVVEVARTVAVTEADVVVLEVVRRDEDAPRDDREEHEHECDSKPPREIGPASAGRLEEGEHGEDGAIRERVAFARK